MKASDILNHALRITVALNTEDDLTARQLRDVLHDLETALRNAIPLAPCAHDGTRWTKHGESISRCGICGRMVDT